MIVLFIDLSASVETTHVTINQKDQVFVAYFQHHGTMMCHSYGM